MSKTQFTREELINELVNHMLDEIDAYTSFEKVCANMIKNGTTALNTLPDEELLDLYKDYFKPEDEITIINN